jgi:hypothetical protein
MSEIIGLKIVVDGQERVVKSTGEIRKILKEAQFEAIALSQKFGETSKEALDAAKKVALMKDQIQDTSERIGLFDPGKKFQVFSNSISAVAGGFTALQGAMGLFGAEAENVQKSLLKVQSALALSQGLSTITDSAKDFQRLAGVIKTQVVTAFSTLRGAIIATGIGALAVGLGLLVANFEAVKKAVLSAIPGLETFGKWIGKTIDSITDFVGVTSEASRALDELTKSTIATNKSLDFSIKLLEAQGGREAEVYELKKQRIENERKLLLEQLKIKGDLDDKERDALLNLNADLAVLDETEKNRLKKKSEDDAKEAFEKQLEREAAQRAALDKQYEIELEAYNKRKALRGKEQQENIDSYKGLSEQRAEQKAIEDKKAKDDAELLLQMQNSALGKMLEANAAAGAKKLADDKANADAGKQIAKAESDAKIASLQATAAAITSLSMLAGKETTAGKALAVAASLINTYAAIAGQLRASTSSPAAAIPGWAIAQAIATGIAGLAAVKQIVSVQVPGGGGGGSVPSAPNLNAGSPLQPSTIAANQVTLDQRSINAMGNRAIKAYVVETEISSAQQKIRRIQKQTTFG